jgi:hypothetical protein
VQVPRLIALAIAMLLVSTSIVFADNKVPQHSNDPMMQMPIVAPLFLEDANFTSTLVLVNAASVREYADVSLRGVDGKVIVSQRVHFSPHSERRFEIASLLRSSGSSVTSGSIVVTPSPDSGGAIAAALSMTYRTQPELNYIDEELAMPSMEGSQISRAVADSGEGSPIVAITSLAESVQRVKIECVLPAGVRFSKTVELKPGETLLTEACAAETTHGFDFQAVWNGAKSTPHRDAVGISLASDAMPGSYAAFALAPHGKEREKFFSAIPFADPKMRISNTVVFAGVPVGRSALLPEGTYVPQLSLANFSDKQATVSVRYSQTSGDSLRFAVVARVAVKADSGSRGTPPGEIGCARSERGE